MVASCRPGPYEYFTVVDRVHDPATQPHVQHEHQFRAARVLDECAAPPVRRPLLGRPVPRPSVKAALMLAVREVGVNLTN